MIAVMSPVNGLGNNAVKTTANGPIKAQNKDANTLNQKDAAQEDRSEYEQALSEVSGADEGQSKDSASSVSEKESSTARIDTDNDPATTDTPPVPLVIQPDIKPVPVSGSTDAQAGELPCELVAQPPGGKVAVDTQVTQAQSITVLQSLKHQAKTAGGSATQPIKAELRGHAETEAAEIKFAGVKTAAVTSTSDAASSTDSAAAVKAAMALASATTVKESMPLTLEGALASAHHAKKNLDVTSLRVEQQVGDAANIDRLSPQPAPAKYEWSMVKLDSQQQSWSRQLCNVLQDRIEMHVNQHIKQAKIRLDPPELGRLDLTVRFEGDRLSVVVHSSNASVREALQDSLSDLQGGLADQFGAGVDVNVGGDSLPKQFKESENSVALHSVEEQETIEQLPAHMSGWINALA